jgi:3-oxoadipate enol-lactonase
MPPTPPSTLPPGVSTLRLGDIDVRVRTAGEGRPIVFVHGLAQDHRGWRAQQDAISGSQTVAYDLRGHGRTTVGRPRGELAQLGQDLINLLEKAVGPAACVGHSLGGTIVLWAAAARPDLVTAVVASGTSSVVSQSAANFYLERVALVREGRMKELAEAVRNDTAAMVVDSAAIDFDRLTAQRMEAIGDGAGYVNAATAMAGMRQAPLQRMLPQVTCPVLLMAGEHDQFCPRRAVDIMLEGMPHAAYVEIPGTGHLLNLERPGAYTDAILRFLEGVPA